MSDSTNPRRAAIVFGNGITAERVAAYLPSNYYVADADETLRDGDSVIIVGRDSAGWTLNDYVLPRLASGLMFGEEFTP